MYDVQVLCGLLQPLCITYRRYVGCYILYTCCAGVIWDVAYSLGMLHALCGLSQPLCIMYMRYVGCYILYVGCYSLYV